MLEKAVQFLKANPVQYLATIGVDGKPKVRPFQFMMEKDKKLYFCTCNEKKVFRELQKNPYVELCVLNNKMEWIRIAGNIEFTDDEKIKKSIIENNELVKGIYKKWDNPIFEVFYMDKVDFFIRNISETIYEESH